MGYPQLATYQDIKGQPIHVDVTYDAAHTSAKILVSGSVREALPRSEENNAATSYGSRSAYTCTTPAPNVSEMPLI